MSPALVATFENYKTVKNSQQISVWERASVENPQGQVLEKSVQITAVAYKSTASCCQYIDMWQGVKSDADTPAHKLKHIAYWFGYSLSF